MYQRPRKLTEFDIRMTRVFVFLCGLGLIGYSGRELALDPDLTNTANWIFLLMMAGGIWCLYTACLGKLKRLEQMDLLGGSGSEPVIGLLVLLIAIVSFVVALFLPEREER